MRGGGGAKNKPTKIKKYPFIKMYRTENKDKNKLKQK